MEKSVVLLDFVEIDQMIQVHGENNLSLFGLLAHMLSAQSTDYLGVSFTTRDANSKAAASEATNIFQSHYPELLVSINVHRALELFIHCPCQYKKFFINIPTIFNWIFWLFKPLISANTLAKMSVVGTGEQAIKKALVPFIDSKELPKRYGGEAKAF